MNGFRADLDALAQLVDRLQAFDRRATSIAADLEQDTRQLDARWSGVAADSHAAAHRRWVQAHDRLRRAANDLAVFVRDAHGNYCDAAEANVRMWA